MRTPSRVQSVLSHSVIEVANSVYFNKLTMFSCMLFKKNLTQVIVELTYGRTPTIGTQKIFERRFRIFLPHFSSLHPNFNINSQ